MRIVITYPDWRQLRERADAHRAGDPDASIDDDDFFAVTMKGEDVSGRHSDLYEVVFNEDVPEADGNDDHRVLGYLFERFNIGDHGGKRIRSMSVGDQVSLDGRCYVCKPVGWEQLPA